MGETESFESTIGKLKQASEIFSRLEIEVASCCNVKLMKLLYIFYLKYVQLNGGTPGDDFKHFRYYAWENGPVETTVYWNIGLVKDWSKNHTQPQWHNFKNSNHDILSESLTYVNNKFADKSAEYLVDFTHKTLKKWSATSYEELMVFSGIEDFAEEYNNLPS